MLAHVGWELQGVVAMYVPCLFQLWMGRCVVVMRIPLIYEQINPNNGSQRSFLVTNKKITIPR